MKRSSLIFGSVLALVLLCIVFCMGPHEPWYHGRPISSWLAKYGDGPGNYTPSPEADQALRQMGSNAVPYLLKLLLSTNDHSYNTFVVKPNQPGMAPVWTPSASTLGEHLKAWSINLQSRFQKVTVPASWNHWKAYLAFQALGAEGRSAIPDLARLVRESDTNFNLSTGHVGEGASIRFWKDQKWIPVIAAQSSTYLTHGSPVFPVSFYGIDYTTIPQPFLKDGEIAAWSLAAIGADSVPLLMAMLTNSNPQIRCRAATALGMMGKAAEPAVPALIKLLEDRGGSNSAAWHPNPYAYSSYLGSVPYDPAIDARREAADALGWIGQQPDLVVPVLIKVLGDQDIEITAIDSLGAMREHATNALPALLALFQTEYNAVDQTRGQYMIDEIALALNDISSDTTRKEVIPLLISRIQAPRSPWNQSMTLHTLGQMTNQPEMVLPVLLEALDQADNPTRSSIVYQLGNFGPAATCAIPKLISFSTGPDTNLCRLATNTLDKIKPDWRTGR